MFPPQHYCTIHNLKEKEGERELIDRKKKEKKKGKYIAHVIVVKVITTSLYVV
jgi:hypothetical protein